MFLVNTFCRFDINPSGTLTCCVASVDSAAVTAGVTITTVAAAAVTYKVKN